MVEHLALHEGGDVGGGDTNFSFDRAPTLIDVAFPVSESTLPVARYSFEPFAHAVPLCLTVMVAVVVPLAFQVNTPF